MSGSNFGLAPPVVVNPLQAQSTALDAAGKVYDLRDKQATEAWGNALQQATDADGNVNYPRAQALASKDPLARQGMLKALGQTSTIQGQQLQQGIDRNKAVSNAIVGALDGDDAGLHDRVVGGLRSLVASGGWTQEQATRAALALPADPTQLRQRLQQIQISLMPTSEQTTQIQGTPVTINQGGQMTGGSQSRKTGAITTSGSGVPLGLTPEQEAELVEITDNRKTLPDGSPNPNYNQKTQITRGDALRAAGIDPRNPGGANPNVGTGRPPPALVNPNGPQPGAPAAPAPRPVSSPPTRSDQDLADKSGSRFQADIDQGNEQNTTQATLSNMQSDINRFTTGSGAQRTLDWKRAAEYWAPGLARMAGVKSDAVAAQESFQKAVAMIVSQQSRGTDKGQELQMHATPNDYLSPEGADTIIRQLQGNADYLQARAKLAQAWPNRTDYGGFQTSVKDLDPRYFQYNHLTPEQKTAYFNGLPEKEREVFKSSYAKTQAMVSGR